MNSAVSEEKSKMAQPIRDWGGYLGFPIYPKNTNLVEDAEVIKELGRLYVLKCPA